MTCFKPIKLIFNANVSSYRLDIFDGCYKFTKIITSPNTCVFITPSSNCIKVLATPLDTAYNSSQYITVYLGNNNCYAYNFRFISTNFAPVGTLYRFTLTDATYGFGLNGTLNFASV